MGNFCMILGATLCAAALVLFVTTLVDLPNRTHVEGTVVSVGQYDLDLEYQDAQGQTQRTSLSGTGTNGGFEVGQSLAAYLKDDPREAAKDDVISVHTVSITLGGFGSIMLLLGVLLTFGSFSTIFITLCGLGVLVSLSIGILTVGNLVRLQLTGTTVTGQVVRDYIDHYTKVRSDKNDRTSRTVSVARRALVVQYSSPVEGLREVTFYSPHTEVTTGGEVDLVVDFSAKPPQAELKGWSEALQSLILVAIFIAVFLAAAILIVKFSKRWGW